MVHRYPLSMKIAFTLLVIILFFYGIIVAKEFLYPIVLGVLLGYLFYPLTSFMEKRGIPRIPASLISVLLFMSIIGTAIILLYKQAGNLIDDFPVYKLQALKNIDKLESLIEEQFGLRDLRLVEFIRGRIKFFFEAGSDAMNKTFTNAAGTVFRLGILPIYTFLFLYYRTKLAYFIMQMVPRENRKVAVKVLKDFSHVVSRYMGGISTVVIILAILNTSGLIIIGVKNALVFGIVSASCSFIPYFGTLIGGSLPFVFSLLTSESPYTTIKVLIFYLFINALENNILTPNIVGSNLRLNPLAIIVGLVAGGMVWGIPGMFAVVPVMAMFNIMSENVPGLHAYSFLLGTSGTRKHALTVENIKYFWARLKNNLKKQRKN